MIGTSTFVYLGLTIAAGAILPLGVAIWWLKTKHEKISTVLVGAATWFLFAIVLETIPKSILFNQSLPIGKAVYGNAVLFTLIGALLAGIFEETGRLVAFKTVLKNRTNKETGISHGIGHGGFEAMFLILSGFIQYLVYCIMINAGTFDALIEQTAATGADVSSLRALPEALASMNLTNSILPLVERVFAMLLHVGLSIMVFTGVKEKKISLYILAVVMHTLFDVPAALYQFGAINVYVTEAFLAVYSVVFFAVVYIKLYRDKGESSK